MINPAGPLLESHNLNSVQSKKELLLESWVEKSELDSPGDLLGEGRGFKISSYNPKCFTIGRRLDLQD